MKAGILSRIGLNCIAIIGLLLMPGTGNCASPLITDNHQEVVQSYDLSNPPDKVWIWQWSGDIAFHPRGDWQGAWVCLSDTDASSGACPTSLIWAQFGTTDIRLRFTEQRSSRTVILNVNGNASARCSDMLLNSVGCQHSGALRVSIPAQELKKLPFGGIWTAHLELNSRTWEPIISLAGEPSYYYRTRWDANITLNVTDTNNAALLFPASGSATPVVDLNLRPSSAHLISGQSALDMCLYDGFGANSNQLELSFHDAVDNSAPPAWLPRTEFAVVNDRSPAGMCHWGGVQAAADCVGYNVALNYNGQAIRVRENAPVILTGVNQVPVHSVTLPGIPEPVMCVPASLTFNTPSFPVWQRVSGNYTGALTVTMKVPALTP